jgi:hypothetical protein
MKRKPNWFFNLDDVGMSEWEDRNEKKVIVPMTMDGQMIRHGASRSVKHISVTAYILAGGESLMPFIVTSQISDDIRKRLMSRGIRLGSLLCCGNDRNHMSAVSFSSKTSR